MKRYLWLLISLLLISTIAHADGLSTMPGQRAHQGSVVLPVQGGTGIRQYTAGDILYASNSNTLVKLPIGSSNFMMIVSGGIPAWSAASSLSPAFVGTNFTGTAASLTCGTVTTNANLTGDVTSSGNATTIAANAVSNAKMATMAANTVKVNATAGSAVPTDLAIAASQFPCRGSSGNIVACTVGTGLSMSSGGALSAVGMTQATMQASTSGTAINFTSIPSTVKQISVTFSGVSTSGTSNMLIQVGPGSYISTGYVGGGTHGATAASSTAGYLVGVSAASGIVNGTIVLTLMDSATNTWTASGVIYDTGSSTIGSTGGYIALAGALTQLRITTVNGTDTFDAGNLNIVYE